MQESDNHIKVVRESNNQPTRAVCNDIPWDAALFGHDAVQGSGIKLVSPDKRSYRSLAWKSKQIRNNALFIRNKPCDIEDCFG